MTLLRRRPRTAPGERVLLGFDFGTRHIGIAVGQEITATARPLTSVERRSNRPDWDAITALIEAWQPDGLVVGIPYHLDGTESPLTRLARRFGQQLHGRFGLPVFEADERLSSATAAREAMGRRGAITKADLDPLAARIILEDWLGAHGAQG
jgi:putative Holliday junction resolvase